MGMYTELIFKGETKADLPEDIKVLIEYFFGNEIESIPDNFELPKHEFFKCDRWRSVGKCSSYYHFPINIVDHIKDSFNNHYYVFSRSDFKNYDNEIALFLDWIKPHMEEFNGWHWYEEDRVPTFFKFNGELLK